MSLALFFAQHVSNARTFIFRSLRLSVGILLWFDVCWRYGVVRLGWCGILMQAEALVPQPAFETCWAKNKASDISWSIFIQLGNILIICRRQPLFGIQVTNLPQIHVALRWTRKSREVSPYFCTLWALQMFSVNVTRREECSILLNIIHIAQAATAAWYKTTKALISDSFFMLSKISKRWLVLLCPFVRPFVCPHVTTWIPLGGSSYFDILGFFENVLRKFVSH